MMLLNFKDVEELRLIENALYFYRYNLPSGDDTFKCDDMITKEELITNLIRDLESEKYKALQEIKNIDKAINELEKK